MRRKQVEHDFKIQFYIFYGFILETPLSLREKHRRPAECGREVVVLSLSQFVIPLERATGKHNSGTAYENPIFPLAMVIFCRFSGCGRFLGSYYAGKLELLE